jgi:hypothetical protein
MIALELEVLAKKHDRFGWDRDRGTAAHDRIVLDWMDALQDFPFEEVRAACRNAVIDNPNRIPNEGHVRAQIMTERARMVARYRRPEPEPEPRRTVTREQAEAILAEAGFSLRRMPAGDA